MARQILIGPLAPVHSEVGDAAICRGAVELLRRHFPSARIVGWSCGSSPWRGEARDAWMQAYGVDDVIHSPTTEHSTVRNVGRIAGEALSAATLSAFGERSLRNRLLRRSLGGQSDIVEAVRDSDLVVLRGGGWLSSSGCRSDMWLRLHPLREVLMARAFGIPYALWGHSIWDLSGPFSKRVMWPVIRDSMATVCRERLTYDYLASLGAPRERLLVLPDTAFGVTPAPRERAEEILAREGVVDSCDAALVGVNAMFGRWARSSGAGAGERLVESLAATLEHLHRRFGARALVVSHCHSTDLFPIPRASEDREVLRYVAARMGNPDWVHTFEGDYTVGELAAVYGCLRIMISGRLHPAILAAVAGTPSVTISYERHKGHGVAEMMGLAEYVVDSDVVVPEALIAKADQLCDQRDRVAREVADRVAKMKNELDCYARTVAEATGP